MRLKEYVQKYGTPITVLARRSNLCVSTLHKILAGTEPGLKSAIAIEDATEGAVTCRDLVRPEGELSPAQSQKASKIAKERNASKKNKGSKANA